MKSLIAIVVGLAASVALAWGLHGVAQLSSCGGYGQQPCPPEATPYFIALIVGLMVSIATPRINFLLKLSMISLALGTGAIWAGLALPEGQGTVQLVLGGFFLVSGLLELMLLPLVILGKGQPPRLITEGSPAIATVLAVRETGVTVNMNPRVELELRIQPQDGSEAFVHRRKMLVSRLAIPTPGRCYPAWFDPAKPDNLLLMTQLEPDAAPPVRQLFEAAKAAEQAAAGAAAPPPDPLQQLSKLHELYQAGALTEAEFTAQKAKLLNET